MSNSMNINNRPKTKRSPKLPTTPFLTTQLYDSYRPPSKDYYTPSQLSKALEYEIDFIQNQVSREGCDRLSLIDVNTRLGVADLALLAHAVYRNFFDPTVMKTMQCVVDSMWVTAEPQEGVLVTPNIRAQQFLVELLRIGVESVEGVAISARFAPPGSLITSTDITTRNDLKPFVVKAPRRKKMVNVNGTLRDVALIHECFVGLILNSLRDESYFNFAYVYGGFNCGPPIFKSVESPDPAEAIKNSKEVLTWCDVNSALHSSTVNYVAYENIQPGISFREYMKQCTTAQWLSAYLQVLYAINKAYDMYEFTHYDLHSDNVLIRKINGLDIFCLSYITDTRESETTEYIVADGVATLIDYGMSHVKYKGRHYGSTTNEAIGILPKQGSLLADAWKLLGSSIKAAVAYKNEKLYNDIIGLVTYFTDEDPVTFIKKSSDKYFGAFTGPRTSKFNMLDYATWVRSTLTVSEKIIFPDKPKELVLVGCQWLGGSADACITTDGPSPTSSDNFYQRIFNSAPNSYSIFEFYDVYTTLKQGFKEGNQQSKEMINRIISNYNYPKASGMSDDLLRSLVKSFVQFIPLSQIITIPRIGMTRLSYVAYFRKFIELLVWAFKTRKLLKLINNIQVQVARIFNTPYVSPLSSQDISVYDQASDLLNKGIYEASKMYNDLMNDPEINDRSNKEYEWFRETMPVISKLLKFK